MARQRLDRVLAHLRVGTRREIREMVRRGRVEIGGAPVSDPGLQVDPESVSIRVDGQALRFREHFHVLLHKPAGVITATEDLRQETVLQVLPANLYRPDLRPVGRLDRETEGLLLLTTDGELGHRLLSPKRHVQKRYLARLDRPLGQSDGAAFAAGIRLDDGYLCLPAELEPIGPSEAVVSLREGKYHQVRRMFAALGNHVLYLRRLSMGPLELGDLPVGQARPLSEAEVLLLRAAAGLYGEAE